MATEKVVALYDKVMKLPTSDKLRFAAELIDKGDLVTSQAMVERALDELSAARIIRKSAK